MKREQKVWCIVFEYSEIQEALLVRTEHQCSLGIYTDVDSTIWRIKDEEKIKELDSLFGLQDRWGSEWYINFHLEDGPQSGPRMIVCSSLEKAYWYLRKEILNKQQEIEALEYILATKEEDNNHVVSKLQTYIRPKLIVKHDAGEKSIMIESFSNQMYYTYSYMGETVNHMLHEGLGVEEGTLDDDNVIMTISPNYMDFNIQREVFDRVMTSYDALPPVADKLQQIWNSNHPYFELEFVHCGGNIDTHNFFNYRTKCIGSDMKYEDMLHKISCQLTLALAIAARTQKNDKSHNKPIQFVLSPEAAVVQSELIAKSNNHIVMTYALDNKQEKYYAIAKPIHVKCCQRPNGTVYMRIECDPYNVRSISGREYVSMVSKGESVLDTMIGTH